MIERFYLRSLGMVIPASAFSVIEFTKTSSERYEIDLSQRVVNPLVKTIESIAITANIHITDAEVIKMLPKEENDSDEDETEEEEQPKRRGRGRPPKEEKEEPKIEPVTIAVDVLSLDLIKEQKPLNESTPLVTLASRSPKNHAVMSKKLIAITGLFSQLEQVHQALEQETTNINDELSQSLADMIPGVAARVDNVQATAIQEYRARHRQTESAIIEEINDAFAWFQENFDERLASEEETSPLNSDIDFGNGQKKTVTEIVQMFFKDELIRV